ncbi:hypothetical protein OJ253_3172 [Cryptosporidium canis]|uniref:PI31 proteasome regulator N-terminal domain-containing protein n=1 Tax=Cryptosporidium canis TaxID=195482 RepID=A0A9D5DH13_9CRYT|nr:hypothetical protein OJ253_3172 [Cryptosporidium canis]
MENSFWMPILFRYLKLESLQDKISIIIHSLLLDYGFVPVQYNNINAERQVEETLNSSNSLEDFELLISSKTGGISIEILPSSWRSSNGVNKLFYISKSHFTHASKIIPELEIELTSSTESVFSIIKSYTEKEILTMEFLIKMFEGHNSDDQRMLELSNSIKKKVDEFLNLKVYSKGRNSRVFAGVSQTTIDPKHEPFEGAAISSFQRCIGNNHYKRVDPLIDDNGIRGSLVGPNSIIFKNRPSRVGKPNIIPTSSIPGGTTIPDNDMFLPPGSNYNNTLNFSGY